jgi:hypothetical protein
MRVMLPVRLLAVAALAGSASLAVVLPASQAFAKVAKPTKVICTGLSGNSSTATVSGCSDTAVTGGGGVSVISSGVSTVTWNVTGLTSTESFTAVASTGKKDHCTPPAGLTNTAEVKEKGTVSGGTATSLTGGKLKGTVCLFSNNSVALFPGTSLDF